MKDRIEQIVKRRVQQLAETAAKTGTVAQEELDAVKRLVTLDELSAANTKTGRQWPILAAALLTMVIVSGLIFSHVRETEIELDARVSEISFEVPAQQVILGTEVLPFLGARGLGRVVVPDASSLADQTLTAGDGELCELALEVDDQQSGGSSVSIPSLAVPAGTRVAVTSPRANRMDLTLSPPSGAQVALELSAKGHIKLVARSSTTTLQRTDNFTFPRLIQLSGASPTPLTLELSASPQAPLAFSAQIPMRNMSLRQVEERVQGTDMYARRVSSLLSGTLYLESLNGKQLIIRPYEDLVFRSSAGVIRTLALLPSEPDAIAKNAFQVRAHARVQGMTIGAEDNTRSLMPSYLEWLAARQGLALFWGASLYLTGLVASVFRWLKISQ